MNKITNNFFAVVFPGQGSQTIGMLKELAAELPIVQKTFTEASQILGYDLWDIAQNGPEEKLNQTEFTQPIMLTADIACWRVWQEKNGEYPAYVAGHSLGEYAALVCAESLTFIDALKLVQARAKFMQQAFTGKSAMVAIVGLDNDVINSICKQAAENEILVAANYNSIGQTVLAGELAAADRAVNLAKQAGAKIAKLLPVSVPSHCELMRPATALLAEQLKNIIILPPKTRVIHNADVCTYNNPEQIGEVLVKQLYCPVRWVETIQLMVQNGVNTILECGPGKVLTGLNKRIDKNLILKNI